MSKKRDDSDSYCGRGHRHLQSPPCSGAHGEYGVTGSGILYRHRETGRSSSRRKATGESGEETCQLVVSSQPARILRPRKTNFPFSLAYSSSITTPYLVSSRALSSVTPITYFVSSSPTKTINRASSKVPKKKERLPGSRPQTNRICLVLDSSVTKAIREEK